MTWEVPMLDLANRISVQRDTVNRINRLQREFHELDFAKIAASAMDSETSSPCDRDSDHARGIVAVLIAGEMFFLCPDCGVDAARDTMRATERGDLFEPEVYR